ncbi:MAG: Rpn family recombination-promoting nuclease/putative transposase [Nannocystales bacterium]
MTNAPHDALFKTIFGQPEHAAAELQHILPGHIAARIDWSSLTPQPGTYVDEELADQHSDLLFSAATRPSEEPVFVYVLFEHQSTAQPRMALRLLRYMVRIWTRHASEYPKDPLPLISLRSSPTSRGAGRLPVGSPTCSQPRSPNSRRASSPTSSTQSTTSTTPATPTCALGSSPTPRGSPCGCCATLVTETRFFEISRRGQGTSNRSRKHPEAKTCSSCSCATSPRPHATCSCPSSVPSLMGRRPLPRP